MDAIRRKLFKDVNLEDHFFDSLKNDYAGFAGWFNKKAKKGEFAYIFEDDGIQGFLYLKEEEDEDNSITPKLDIKRRLKVGTFKIEAHGTKLGERFVKIIIDEIFNKNYDEAYVTIFEKHPELINLLEKYGFEYYGKKKTEGSIEEENVYFKYSNSFENEIFLDYPRLNIANNNKFMLSIWPTFHTRMFPDSKLKTEKNHVIEDISVTNSIEKIYLSAANISNYKKGDMVVIYRTAESGKSAEYSAVATSVCVVDEIKHINSFVTYEEFNNYCRKHSVFTEAELREFWRTKKYKYLIKMLYNVALNKRPIRKELIEEVGLVRGDRWVSVKLTDDQFEKILELGEVDESFIIN